MVKVGARFLNVAGDDLARETQEEEGKGEEGATKEVAEGSEVRDGRVVRVNVPVPHRKHDHPADVEQEGDLEHGGHHVGQQEDGGGVSVTSLQVADGEGEHQVTRHHQ